MMKKLLIHFFDTAETLLLDGNRDVFAWENHKDDGLSSNVVLEFDHKLPETLRKKALMFYVYDDIAILKLYRSVYIDSMEWID